MPAITTGVFPDFETKRLTVAHWAPGPSDAQARARLEAVLADRLSAQVLTPMPLSLQITGPETVGTQIPRRFRAQ